MNNFDYDIFLEYLSSKKNGSWTQFKKYIDDLNYDDNPEINYGEIRQMFSRLGHIEFSFTEKNEFSVCKSAICILENSYRGILTGYRTKNFLNKLEEICKKSDLTYEKQDNNNSPKLIIIDFKNEQKLNSFREKNGLSIEISKDFSSNVLKIMPDIEVFVNNIQQEKENIDLSNSFKKYDIEQCKFKKLESKNATLGLYCQEFFDEKRYYLFSNNKWIKVDKNYGIFKIFLLNNNINLIKFRGNKLIISKYIHFPELIDRALAMVTGKNPDIKNNKRIYDNIDLYFAKQIARKFGQNLEVING